MKKYLWIVVLGLFLSGCATQANYVKILDSWVGSTESQLVSSWGPPLGSYTEENGTNILTSPQLGSYNSPGTPLIDSMTGMPTRTAGPTVVTNCTTRFYTSALSGEIINWDYQGNNCIAKDPKSKFKLPF